MKLLMILSLLAVCAREIPADTNRVTITNSAGRVYSDIQLLRSTGDGLLYLETNGGGKIFFRDLPIEIAIKYGYNEADEAKAVEKEQQDQARTAAMFKAAAEARAEKARLARLENTKMIIEGRVVQKVKDGLLVDGMSEVRRQRDHDRGTPFEKFGRAYIAQAWDGNVQLYDGWCLLVGYAGYGAVVDGDTVKIGAYPDGEYNYPTVAGGTKTVRRFQVNAAFVTEPADAATMAKIKGTTHR